MYCLLRYIFSVCRYFIWLVYSYRWIIYPPTFFDYLVMKTILKNGLDTWIYHVKWKFLIIIILLFGVWMGLYVEISRILEETEHLIEKHENNIQFMKCEGFNFWKRFQEVEFKLGQLRKYTHKLWNCYIYFVILFLFIPKLDHAPCMYVLCHVTRLQLATILIFYR